MVALFWWMGSLFTASALLGGSPPRPRGGGSRPSGPTPTPGVSDDGVVDEEGEAKIVEAMREYPEYTVAKIDDVKDEDPKAASSWKRMLRYMPFLTETTAMWFVLQDPDVPNLVKLNVAGAILYAISPYDADWFPVLGWSDDAAFLAEAFWTTYYYITPKHIEQAKAWLESHGVDPKPMFALGKQFDVQLPDGRMERSTPTVE